MTKKAFLLVVFLLVLPIMAHTDDPVDDSTGLTIGWFVILVMGISLVVVGFLYYLHRFQSKPGTLPIKKLTIAAALTILVNAVVFGINFVEV